MRKDRMRNVWVTVVALLSLATLSTSANTAGTAASAEFEERKQFIQKANDEIGERLQRRMDELAKQGVHPLMLVTVLKPFGDWDFYYVSGGNIHWTPNKGQAPKEVVVPMGFVTDLTSIPRIFWQIKRPEGRYAYAAVVHDYLYWTQTRSKAEADLILKLAMEDSKVDPTTVEAIYQAVRKFGQSAWDNNVRLKEKGERRFLVRFPTDYSTSWSEWKKRPDVFGKE